MGGRSSKPLSLVQGHRTNAEKEVRKAAEEALVTKKAMKEWPATKADPIAHKHYLRLNKLYKEIGKNDALNEATINRYCIMLSECERYELDTDRLRQMADDLEGNQGEMEYTDYVKMSLEITKQIQSTDRLLMSKRRMLLDLEKESLMTMAAQLRSIPKKPVEKPKSDMAKFLNKRSGNGG